MSATPGAATLERGREAYARRAWSEAFELLSRADEERPLDGEDLDLLATCAFMLARDDDYLSILERAHHAFLDAGETLRAIRCAFWIGMNLALRGEMGPASGWLGRAQRLLEREEHESVEHGYLLMPLAFRHEAEGEFEAGAAVAARAAAIAERFNDAEAFALATQVQGHMLARAGRVRDGLALMDEAMVAVTAGKLSPIATGIVYCGVILDCREVYEVRRAREWTAALTRWCRQQPDVVAFTGRCLLHRAEIMQLSGAWGAALEEARSAGRRFVETRNPTAGLALYRQAELHRLQGDLDAAEDAYREASHLGWEPQPGLAQLRLAQGRRDAAVAAIRRVAAEAKEPLKRAGMLPAYVEIMLAAGDVDEARAACRELEEIASGYESAMLAALVAHARGAVALAESDAAGALPSLRHALTSWRELEAPYEAARARVLIGLACRALGDDDAAELELDAARSVFVELGAEPDVTRLNSVVGSAAAEHGLTARELEVLRLLAAGKSNREIAGALVISEHTVGRHVQNIFAKLDVSSRAAAGAFAYEHRLV
jgi:ATP/maltotriose-dependent transcriptional regulator MalT